MRNSTAKNDDDSETASLLNTPALPSIPPMRGSISSGEEELDADNSYAARMKSFAIKVASIKIFVLVAMVYAILATILIALPEAGALGKLKNVASDVLLLRGVSANEKSANARSRDVVGINGDGALLVSTSTSVKHSASLGDNTEERGDSNVSEQQQEVAAKQQKEEEEALEELLVGVHDQVYGKKHLIDNNVLNKREGEGLPIFIHIPKAGGTSVEAMVANVGARIGSCNSRETNGASNEAARPYEVHPAWDVGKAEDYHSPPKVVKGKTHLENSFTTVRNPFSRAESEYFWYLLRKYPKEYEVLQNSTENWKTYVNNEGKVYYYNEVLNRATYEEPKPSWMSCEKFGIWLKYSSEFVLKNSLLECYRLGKYSEESIAACDETLSRANGGKGPMESDGSKTIIGKEHTHHVPQYVLGRAAERVFSVEDCFDDKEGFCKDVRTTNNKDVVMQPNLISYLRENFSSKIIPEMVNSISGNKDLNKATLSQCWRNGNMPSETIANFLKAYGVDFEKYAYSKELPEGREKSDVLTSLSSSEAKMGHEEKEQRSLSSKKMSSSWEKAQKERFEKEVELKSLAEARKQELEKRAKLAKKQDEEIEKLTKMSSELAEAKIQAEIQLEETQRQIAEARLKRSKRIVKRRRNNRKLLGGGNVEIPKGTTLEMYDEELLDDEGRLGLDFDHNKPTNRKTLFCAGGLRVPRVHVEKDSEVGWSVWNTDKELRDEMIERGELATSS